MKRGFTLIELLVVVLIIGILAAVALPQYAKVVEKSKGIQIMTFVKSLYQAQEVYFMANGKYSEELDNLDITFPTEGTGVFEGRYDDMISNGEWVVYTNSDAPDTNSSCATRAKGAYKGCGFCIHVGFSPSKEWINRELVCSEALPSYEGTPGSCCQKLYNGKLVYAGTSRIYSIPQP